MVLKPFITVLIAVILLLASGTSYAQDIRVSFSQNPIQEGEGTTVTMTFSGLPLNTNMQFHGCVRENYPACEGGGLGGVFDFFTGNSNSLTRTGTIVSSCPAGSYHLDVDLRNADGTVLKQTSMRFTVGDAAVDLGGAFHRLGALGLVFRQNHPELAVEVWGISPESEGYFLLRASQSQIDAARDQSFVARSEDGRAVIRVGAAPDRDVTISLGPNAEGKVHHVTLAEGLNGEIISTFDTQEAWPPGQLPANLFTTSQTTAGDAPTLAFAPPVIPQDPRADGSLVHTVRQDDTIHTIAQAYGIHWQVIVEQNRLSHGGRWIYIGQPLIIRDAGQVVGAAESEADDLPQPVFKGDDSE